jgi:hypothetical protein
MRYKFKPGQLYKITFLDHCMNEMEPCTCEVVGWCLDDDKDFVVTTHFRKVEKL